MMAKDISPILLGLNPQQQEAVTHWGSPLLILAGAGSGKTRVLTHRTAWLIGAKGFAAGDLLLLTFTNKAAREMKHRVQSLLPRGDTPYAGTFHSFCAQVMRKSGNVLGLAPTFVIYDAGDQLDALKIAIANLGLEKSVKPAAAHAVISQAKNEIISPLEYMEYARGDFQKNIAKVYLEYQKILRNNEALDFDDLLVLTVKLFKTEPEVLNRYRNRFQYVMVDEWQDTNKAQYEIIKMLVARDRHLTVVGDAAQSIYAWRGADYRNINYLKKDFPDLATINLEQNYRSTQTILDAAYGVISHNKNHPILELWTEKEKGDKIKLYQARSEIDEADFVLKQIKELKSQGYQYDDVAVLYRTNAQSRVLEEAFLHHGIPYVLFGGTRFYDRREIKDVIAYLRLAVNPKDSVSEKRIEKLGKTRFNKYKIWLENDVKLANNQILISDKETVTLDLLDKILSVTGYLDLYDAENEEDAMRLENVKELRSVATEFPNPYDFLEQVALVETIQNTKGRPLGNADTGNAVTLMTTHSAKGLEFRSVFIVGMEEGLFPHSRALMDAEELEEERRLAYVGITRAMEKLCLTFARRRLIYGQSGSSAPSRFLAEIPEKLFDNIFSDQKPSFNNFKKSDDFDDFDW
jgi:DNA helicase II / ATP-dependent DNA helicase PcrA